MNHIYRLGGLKVASYIDLSGWIPRDVPVDTPADVVFRLGNVPPQLQAPDHVASVFQTRGRSQCLLALPGTGRILIENGNSVTLEPESDCGTELSAAGALFTGPVQGVLWHQRGLLPLRASSIVVDDGRALILAGPSAMGKSTLAAMFAVKGHAVLADGICVLRASDAGEISVQPGNPRLRLWHDALERLGLSADGASRIGSDREVFLVDLGQDAVHEPRKPAAVILLTHRGSGALTTERLRGQHAVGALDYVVQARRAARALGCGANIFAALTRLAAAVPVWLLTMTDDPACLGEAVAAVLEV
jgi:hypothetical protein